MKGTDAKLVCVLISEADRVLDFTTALPAPDISSEPTHTPTPCRAPRQAACRCPDVGPCCCRSAHSSPPDVASCPLPSMNQDDEGVDIGCLDSLHFQASLQPLWVKIGGVFLLCGRLRDFFRGGGGIHPALQQMCQAKAGKRRRRRRSSGILPLWLWLGQSCQTPPWASCCSCSLEEPPGRLRICRPGCHMTSMPNIPCGRQNGASVWFTDERRLSGC